tara:strand:+ start:621 stop:1529 length:909 start_codon:yes stop_codon:yes gene_type:complete
MKNKTSSISIVIPVFNGERFITDALNSIEVPPNVDVEVIVINDKSTDSTSEVLQAFGRDIIIIDNETNQGASHSRNRGILASTGQFIAFLDADDIWLPKKLCRQIKILEENPSCKMTYGDSPIISFDKYTSKPSDDGSYSDYPHTVKSVEDIFINPYFSTSTILVERDLCIAVGLFREDLKTAEDIDLCLKLAALTQVVKMDMPLSITRRVEGSLGASATSYQDNLTVIESFVMTNPEFAQNNSGLVKKAKRKIYDDWLKDLIVSRQINKAINLCVKSFHIKPSKLTVSLLFKALILRLKYR